MIVDDVDNVQCVLLEGWGYSTEHLRIFNFRNIAKNMSKDMD